MTVAAGKVKADLTSSKTTVFIDLADLSRINRDHVCAHISCEAQHVGGATLDQSWHMTIGAADVECHMGGVILELGFLIMAILAQKVGSLLTIAA
jgi:hypothetical protein